MVDWVGIEAPWHTFGLRGGRARIVLDGDRSAGRIATSGGDGGSSAKYEQCQAAAGALGQ
jgi:hypothetical protein